MREKVIIKSILNNPYIVAIISGIAILIISYFVNKNKKILSYKIISNNLLITNSEKIKISYSDKEINNIYNVCDDRHYKLHNITM